MFGIILCLFCFIVVDGCIDNKLSLFVFGESKVSWRCLFEGRVWMSSRVIYRSNKFWFIKLGFLWELFCSIY